MADRFVFTRNGFVNLRRIDAVRRNSSGRYILLEGETVLDDNNPSFDETIISIISPEGEWECLTLCTEDDGTNSIAVEPVVGFGLTVFGETRPLIPSAMNGEVSGYMLRRAGQKEISGPSGMFKDEEEWLRYLAEHRVAA